MNTHGRTTHTASAADAVRIYRVIDAAGVPMAG